MRRSGIDLTLITYGALVQKSWLAAQQLAQEKIDAEVINLRSLNPYDWPAIAASVRKTSRALVVYEDMISWGYGAEIAARIGRSKAFPLPRSWYVRISDCQDFAEGAAGGMMISRRPNRRASSESAPGPSNTRAAAINAGRLHNYLVPRECPRMTYYAVGDNTRKIIQPEGKKFVSGSV